MLFRGIPRQADPRCQRISSPLDPLVFGIAMGDHRRKRKTCRGMSGRKGPPAAPKLPCTAWPRKLTVKRELKGQVEGPRGSHRSQRSKSGVPQIRMVLATAEAIRQNTGTNLQAQ